VVTAPDRDEGTLAERVAALRDARAAEPSCEHLSA
jgi:hypothetical protein